MPLPLSVNKDEFCIAMFTEGSIFPTIKKCIKVKRDCEISFWIYGNQINIETLKIEPAYNILQFKENIKQFESILICNGGPSSDQYPLAPVSLCNKTATGLLRHNECEIIIKSNSLCCDKCKILKGILKCRQKRKAEGCEEKLKLSPLKKEN